MIKHCCGLDYRGIGSADRSSGVRSRRGTVPVIGPIGQPVPLIARGDSPPDRARSPNLSGDRSVVG